MRKAAMGRPCVDRFFKWAMLFFSMVFSTAALWGCISLPLNVLESTPEKTANIEWLSPPPAPFIMTEKKKNQALLQNPNNHNIILVRSICPKNRDSLLQEFQNSVTDGSVTQDPQPLIIDERPAQRYWIQGNKEGFPYRIELIQYEKFSCLTSLVYLAQAKVFDQDLDYFHKIIRQVKVHP